MILSYCPKKNKVVTLLSTMHHQPTIDSTDAEKKPEVIVSYNSTKAGVDTMDRMVRNYSVKKKSRRWPMIIFYNMIDISALNAYIVYASLNPEYFCEKNNGRRNFLITLGKILGGVNEDEEIQRGRDVRVARKRKRETEVEVEDEETEFAGSTKEKRGCCYLCEKSKDRK